MSSVTQIRLRGARDRLLDLLGAGETYPLQDLEVGVDRLTVPVNSTARIPVFPGQTDVRYKLCDPHERPVDASPGVTGTGEETVLETPAITDDITFKILASKIDTKREVFLHRTAPVKVGLDATLSARIVNAPPLDPAAVGPPDTAPRIADYGAVIQVELDRSQEGVDYHLACMQSGAEVVLSEPEVRGNLRTIVLQSKPVSEDIEIRIRATKRFDPSEARPTQTTLLNVVLPLAVRANPALLPAIAGESVIQFGGTATLALPDSQQSVRYALHVRMLSDSDFVYGTVPPSEIIAVSLPGIPAVQVRRPSQAAWARPGYSAFGESQQGSAAALQWTIGPFVDDTIVVVSAHKEHGPDKVASVVQIAAAAVVLVRPNPNVSLAVQAILENPAASSRLLVTGGDPGIFYYMGAAPILPAYFHKLDSDDPRLNKGVGQIRIGIDFVVTRNLPRAVPSGVDLAQLRPASPLIETGPLSLPVSLAVRAVKARTQAGIPLAATAVIAASPEIRPEQATVNPGSQAKILVVASRPDENYQLFSDGNPVGDAQSGNGSDLSFTTEALASDATFEMHITQPAGSGLPVTRVVALAVAVKPSS